MTKNNNKQLFSLALVLGIWSTSISADETIKIDEKAYQEMINKKNREGKILSSRHIPRKTPIISEELMKKLKKMPMTGREKINVVITLKTNSTDIKPFISVGQVSIDRHGNKMVY